MALAALPMAKRSLRGVSSSSTAGPWGIHVCCGRAPVVRDGRGLTPGAPTSRDPCRTRDARPHRRTGRLLRLRPGGRPGPA